MSKEGISISDLPGKLTIVVCSCDAYEDLWDPFFKLLKKYWQPMNLHIILNTESKDYQYSGLDIECVHLSRPNCSYGERMYHVLNEVKTEYCFLLMDDYFIRENVKLTQVCQIIDWMDRDKNIAMFNCDARKLYAEWEPDKYPGFRRVPWGAMYTLNMQAGIWRIKTMKKYWAHKISPWEWELVCNALTSYHLKDKFYISRSFEDSFCKYRPCQAWWGVADGKWISDDVVPLFEKEGIDIDLTKRGMIHSKDIKVNRRGIFECESFYAYNRELKRCLGWRAVGENIFFQLFRPLIRVIYDPFDGDYPEFLCYKTKARFCKKVMPVEGVKLVKKQEIFNRICHKFKTIMRTNRKS
jgi:hypothetical protein